MARIRSVHPGLPTDEAFMEMSLPCKAAWPLLWTLCDDRGVFEWKPKTLKAALFPVDDIDFSAILDEFERLGVVRRVEIDGKPCGLVRNFCRFQSPKFPSYRFALAAGMTAFVAWEEGMIPKDYWQRGGSRLPPEIRRAVEAGERDSLPQGYPSADAALPTGDGDGVGEGDKNISLSAPPRAAASERDEKIIPLLEDEFQEFWELYPVKAAPDEARSAYRGARRKGATAEQILAAVKREKWRDDKRYIPHAARWLAGGAWREAAQADAAPAAKALLNDPYAGWEAGDHVALAAWRRAAANEFRTLDAAHNQLDAAARRAECLRKLQNSAKAYRLVMRELGEEVAA